jgi:trimethylamine--corrinoid protein Co-methyltransferase
MNHFKIDKTRIEDIHEKSLWILENTGVVFDDPSIVEKFKENGFKTDGNRIYINSRKFGEYTSDLKSHFIIKNNIESVEIGKKSVICGPSGSVRITSPKGVRNPSIEDYINIQKLNHTSKALNMTNANLIEITDCVTPIDASIKTALALYYSSKPLVGFASDRNEAESSIKLAKKFIGFPNDYYILGIANVLSPLSYDKDAIGAIMAYVNEQQPICIACCSMPGLTSPISLYGTLIQNNAEVMAGVIMTQLIHPGTPVIYGNSSFGVDMRYASPVPGSVETSMMIPYIKGLSEYYGLPSRSGGSLTDSKVIDWQSGTESSLSLYSSLINDINLIYHAAGELDALMMFSFEKFLLDEELILSIKRLLSASTISQDAYLQSIHKVGPGGNYLYEKDTAVNFRSEHRLPDFSIKNMYDNWVSEGQNTAFSNSSKALIKRLAQYTAPSISADQLKILEFYIENILQGERL